MVATVGRSSDSPNRSGEDARRARARKGDPQRRLGFDGPESEGGRPRQAAAAPPAGSPPWPQEPAPAEPRVPRPGDPGLTAIERAWLRFHAENPTVLSHFLGEALCERDLQLEAGRPPREVRIGAKAIWERLRKKLAPLGVELNNNFTCLYARAAMQERRELRGCFALRRRRGER